MSGPPRILAYAWDHEGLGHVSRLLNILHAVRELRPDAVVGIVAEQDSDLLRRSDFTYVPVPSHRDSYAGRVPGTVQEDRPLHRAVAAATARAAVEVIRPTLVLHDSVVSADLLAEAPGAAHALVLRRNTYMREFLASLGPSLDHLALVILPHRVAEVPRAEIPPGLRSRVVFTGPIVRPAADDGDERIRERYDVPGGARLIVVTGGGGGFADQYRFFEAAARGIAEAATEPTVCVLVLGYFFGGVIQVPQTPGSPVSWRVTRHEPELPTLMRSADAVVTQGGYNTLFEARAVGARVIAIPGARATDDQKARVARIARADPDVVAVSEPEAKQIADGLGSLDLGAPRRPADGVSEGRVRAARALIGLVDDPTSTAGHQPTWDDHVASMRSGTPFQRLGWLRARAAVDGSRLHTLSGAGSRWLAGTLVSAGDDGPEAWIPRGPAGYTTDDIVAAVDAAIEALPGTALTVSPYVGAEEGGTELEAALRDRDFVPGPALWEGASVVLDVAADDDEMLWRLAKKRRAVVRREAADPAVEVVEDLSDGGLAAFERMYGEFAAVRPVSPMPRGYLTRLRENGLGTGLGTVLLAYRDGELCSGVLILCSGDLAWASRAPHRPGRAPMGLTLTWHAMRWARKHGCRRYDLGGIVLDGPHAAETEGLTAFKRALGGSVRRTVPSLRRAAQ